MIQTCFISILPVTDIKVLKQMKTALLDESRTCSILRAALKNW